MIDPCAESSRCLLCASAPCTAACPKGMDPGRGIRAVRFDDIRCAGLYLNAAACTDCDAPCEKACIHYDLPVRVRLIAQAVPSGKAAEPHADLSVDFCGFRCESPFLLASSAVCNNYEMTARAFDMGWAGVVYKTASLMHIEEVSPRFDRIEKGGTSFLGFRNMEQVSANPAEVDFESISRLKRNYPTKLVIASIMGRDTDEWAGLARMAEEAGADMVECNFSCPQMKGKGLGSDVGQNNDLVRLYTSAVKKALRIPVIVKMTPNITHIEEPAEAAKEAGADAIAAINTIKSITPNHRSEVSGKHTVSGYSGRAVKPIAQRMILDIATAGGTKGMPLSGIGGIETWRDALEFIRLGCATVQVCTAVMEYGYRIIDDLTLGLRDYMQNRGIGRLEELVGSGLKDFVTPEELDRATYILPKFNRETCVGCGRCAISCADGGHQAIAFDPAVRKPSLIGKNCVGCHLCMLVCPTGSITPTNRIPKKG